MTTEPAARIGQPVLYTLDQHDAELINKRRHDFRTHTNALVESGDGYPQTGYQAHVGNEAREGQQFPGFVVNVFSGGYANLRVLLDGNDSFWACSVGEGEGPKKWQVQA